MHAHTHKRMCVRIHSQTLHTSQHTDFSTPLSSSSSTCRWPRPTCVKAVCLCLCVHVCVSTFLQVSVMDWDRPNTDWSKQMRDIQSDKAQKHAINSNGERERTKMSGFPCVFGGTLTRHGHNSPAVRRGEQSEQQRGTLHVCEGCGNIRRYLPRRLWTKMCGTLLFLCFRNLILVRISAYGTTQIWPGAMSFSFAHLWNDGTFHGTSNAFVPKIWENRVKHQTLPKYSRG